MDLPTPGKQPGYLQGTLQCKASVSQLGIFGHCNDSDAAPRSWAGPHCAECSKEVFVLLAAKQGTGTITITQLALGVLPLNHQETNFGPCILDWNREMGHHGKGKLNTLLTSPKKKSLGIFQKNTNSRQ